MSDTWTKVLHTAKRIETSSRVDIQFATKQPLGLNVDQVGDWAVVTSVDVNGLAGKNGVVVGSFLAAINGREVLTEEYHTSIHLLANAAWPMTLTFKFPPSKSGVLNKRQRKSAMGKPGWKARKVLLQEGLLVHFSDPAGSSEKGRMPLAGSSVQLSAAQETGRPFCFQLQPTAGRPLAGTRGSTTEDGALLFSTESEEELVQWVGWLLCACRHASGALVEGAAAEGAAAEGQFGPGAGAAAVGYGYGYGSEGGPQVRRRTPRTRAPHPPALQSPTFQSFNHPSDGI